jgi:hypothetical protein
MAMAILLLPNRWPRSNVLLRLSRLSSGLAAAAALGALFGPAPQRALCVDVALVLGGAAFVLWRFALALERRRACPDDIVPDARPIDRDTWAEALVVLESRIASAPTFDAALLAASDGLRGELGAASARALIVQATGSRSTVAEVVAAERPWRTPTVDLRDDGSPLALAIAAQRPVLDWPQAVAVPVVRDARVIAAIELRRFGLDLDEASARALRLFRDDAHRAAERVLAEQSALRTTQHLHALDVEQVEDRSLRTAVVNVVDVNGHAGFERQDVVAETDAADERRERRAPARA